MVFADASCFIIDMAVLFCKTLKVRNSGLKMSLAYTNVWLLSEFLDAWFDNSIVHQANGFSEKG